MGINTDRVIAFTFVLGLGARGRGGVSRIRRSRTRGSTR